MKILLPIINNTMMMTIGVHPASHDRKGIAIFLFIVVVLCSPMNAISIPPFTYHKSINSTNIATSTTSKTNTAAGTTTSSATESAWNDEVALQQSHRYNIESGDIGNRHNDGHIDIERMKENPPAVVGSITQRMMATATCITNETGLRSAIDNAPNFSSTDIEICTNYMKIDTSQPNVITGKRGINIVNKFLHIHCVLPNQAEKCTLDAQLKARHFVIDNSTISFDRMTFMNGKGTNDTYYNGGALLIISSTIQMNDCHLFANEAPVIGFGWGGAIYAKYSSLLLGQINMNNNNAVRSKTRWCCTIMIFHVI
jgi:hypothetical protein